MAQYADLSILNSEWAGILETFPIPQFVSVQEFVRTETELRKKYHESNKPTCTSNPIQDIFNGSFCIVDCLASDDLIVSERLLSVEGGEIPLRTYIPTKKDGDPLTGFPLLVWMFGGGGLPTLWNYY